MFLDTTILVEILRGNEKVTRYVEKVAEREPLLFSIIQIGEIADWCYSNNLEPLQILKQIKDLATVVSITENICLEGSEIKQERRKAGKHKFSFIDGILAASARSFEQKVLTTDKDFQEVEDAIIL
jgi:predicted nucleic acid-binding protein